MSSSGNNKRRTLIRASIVLLAIAFWMLGDVKRSHWIRDSPNGQFSTSLVSIHGWRSIDPQGRYLVYVTDNKTGEKVLATSHPVYCMYEFIALYDVRWENDERRFTCLWTIQYNGVEKQHFQVQSNPLRVKAGPPCCGLK